uniref:Btz domain-containing protein n=1 Tax=Angiostrongylus cantonensis TaxID=6313 RepID=A0A0K0DLJ6_ANGCA
MSAIGGSELALVVKSQDTDSGVEKAEQRPGGTTSSSACSLDEMFSDRYTTNNQSFARISEGFDPVICLYPFHSKPKHFEKNRPHHGSGGGWGSNEPANDWKHDNRGDFRRHPYNKRQRPSWGHH